MNIRRKHELVRNGKWSRYRYNLTTGLGENGQRLTGSAAHIALSRAVAGEGMVLLENNGHLPLREGATVALFGIGTMEYVKGGGGSGMVYPAYVKNLYEGFLEKSPYVTIYEPVSQFYYDYAEAHLNAPDSGNILAEPEVPQELIADAAKNADTAIILIHRYSLEGADRSPEKGDFYLTDTEQQMVTAVTESFSHSVVVLNVGGMVDTAWIRENPKIDGALLAWQAGMEGCGAIADILCGDVNPSGKLVDTFAREFSDYPSADTFHESRDYVNYYEDIYVGYRYFETVPGAKEKVVYPFGYGLSYTTFDFSQPVAKLSGDTIKISFTVQNTGDRPGKEVAQVYFSALQGKLGKPALELADFQKTRLLAPGESQAITVTFPVSQMASYDDLGKCQKSAWVLEGGDYRFFAGSSCRALTEADYRYTVAEDFVVTRQLTQKCAPNLLSRRMLSDGSFEALPQFPVNAVEFTPALNTATAPVGDKPTPFYQVAKGNLDMDAFLAQMTDEELIGMVSGIPKQGLSNTAGWGGIDRLGIPAVMTIDGPAGVRLRPDSGVATTAWPCATLIACTWDTQLMEKIGVAGGMECKENGLACWLTPAMNIHRNPLCGRNFEYFSEDPNLSGAIAAAITRGVQQEEGFYVTVKHFACNNQEDNRNYVSSNVSERALREIYLRSFERCVREGNAKGIMTSYNRVNGVYSPNSHDLCTKVLRNEWGFDGVVMTDWFSTGGNKASTALCMKAGNDLIMPGGGSFKKDILKGLKSGAISEDDLRRCCANVVRSIMNSAIQKEYMG